MNISPKVYLPTVLAIVAGVALYLITGDPSSLIVSLTGLAGGAVGFAAPPAGGLTQDEIVRDLQEPRLS